MVNRSIVQWIVGVASFQKVSFINWRKGQSPFSSCENGDGHDVEAGGGDAGRDHDDNNGGDDAAGGDGDGHDAAGADGDDDDADDAAGGDDDADGGNVPH